MARILLVEDDPNLGFLVQESLEAKGYQVVLCEDGVSGLATYSKENPDLCILDVMLPQMDGFELAQEIRKMNSQTPIIFLTAKARQEDRIQGLTIGADDYLTKPFSLEELHLRLRAILKRVQHYHQASPIVQINQLHFGQSLLDLPNQLLTVKGISQTLTLKETEVLHLLAQHQNTIVKRDTILKAVWEDNGYFVARSMDVFISRLRKYLKPDESIRIASVHGVGYKLETNHSF